MKNRITRKAMRKRAGLIACAAVLSLALASCSNGSTDDSDFERGHLSAVFTSIEDMSAWLDARLPNHRQNPYNISLNVSSLGGSSDTPGSAGNALKYGRYFYKIVNSGYSETIMYKYFVINLNLSGSTITSIESGAFSGCMLYSITIPSSVTSIGNSAFANNTSLTSVTFQGTISSANFGSTTPFPGDLRAKYLAGGPGTYTRPSGGTTWTKQS